MPLLVGVFARVLPWLVTLGGAVLAVQLGIMKTALLWAFDGLLTLAVTVMNSLDIEVPAHDPSSLLSQVPVEVLGALSDLGVPEAMAIVATAYGLRLLLQIIPFTRLGS